MNIKPNKPNSVSTYWKQRADTPVRAGGWELWAQALDPKGDIIIGDGPTIHDAVKDAKWLLKEKYPGRTL